LTVTDRKTTRPAKVAWRNENIVRKDWTRDQAKRGTPKRRKDRERRWMGPECNNGIRDRGLKQKLQGRKRIKDPGDRLPLCPRNERIFSWTYREIDSVKITKQKSGSYAASRKIKDWTLWRGRSLPKQKKITARKAESGNVETPAPNR
jgi:hypothetical protein